MFVLHCEVQVDVNNLEKTNNNLISHVSLEDYILLKLLIFEQVSTSLIDYDLLTKTTGPKFLSF